MYVEFDILDDGRYEVGILFNSAVENERGADRRQTIEVRASNIAFVHDELSEEEIRARQALMERMERLEKKNLISRVVLPDQDETK